MIAGGATRGPNADHVMSWHPGVAVTIADTLDAMATSSDDDDQLAAAATIARAYLDQPGPLHQPLSTESGPSVAVLG